MLITTAFAQVTIVTYDPANKITFSDLPQSHWAYKNVMLMASKGIVSGTTTPVNGVGTYNPEGDVTVGEFLAIATRLVAPDKIDTSINYDHWAVPYYKVALSSELITYRQFLPVSDSLDAPMLREDMAMVLVKVAQHNGENLQIKENIENNISDYPQIDETKREAVKQAYSNGLLTGKENNKFAPKDTLTRAEIATVFCRVMNYTKRPEVTVIDNSEYAKYVVTEDIYTKGRLKGTYSDEFNLKAMDGIKLAEDENGVYAQATAPVLPDVIKDDFRISYDFVLHAPNGDYFSESIHFVLKPGESKKVYFNSFEDTKVLKSQIGDASLRVAIGTTENGNYMKDMYISSTSKTKVRSDWYSDTNSTFIDYDGSHIFSGIGK